MIIVTIFENNNQILKSVVVPGDRTNQWSNDFWEPTCYNTLITYHVIKPRIKKHEKGLKFPTLYLAKWISKLKTSNKNLVIIPQNGSLNLAWVLRLISPLFLNMSAVSNSDFFTDVSELMSEFLTNSTLFRVLFHDLFHLFFQKYLKFFISIDLVNVLKRSFWESFHGRNY
jgi:hypothetical protein